MSKIVENKELCKFKSIGNARLQWQFGDWERLAQTQVEIAQRKDNRIEFLALKASAQLQLGETKAAWQAIEEIPLHKRKEVVIPLLLSGIFNNIGKIKALLGEGRLAKQCFESAIKIAQPDADMLLTTRARQVEQLSQVGLFQTWRYGQFAGPTQLLDTFPDSIKFQNADGVLFYEDLTIEFWIKIKSWPDSWVSIVSKSKNDKLNEFCFRINNSNKGQWYYGDGTEPVAVLSFNPSDTICLGEWSHIALVRENNSYCRIYVDGVIQAERDIHGSPPPLPVTVPVQLVNQENQGKEFVEELRELTLSNTAKTSSQVRQGMKSGNSISKGSLIYPMVGDEVAGRSRLHWIVPERVKRRKFLYASSLQSLDYYELATKLLEKQKKGLNIVIVGANDGKINDPIYPFIKHNADHSKVLLIEPQLELLPYLKDNYSFHPDKKIACCAIGQDGGATLYTVKEAYWSKLDVPYAKERQWPLYRAPTGVASSNKDFLVEWLNKHLKEGDAYDAIQESFIVSKSLNEVIEEQEFPKNINLLQIDTEGFDDQVIYASDIESIKPEMIHFEKSLLTDDQSLKVFSYLEKLEYKVFKIGRDAIALHNSFDLILN